MEDSNPNFFEKAKNFQSAGPVILILFIFLLGGATATGVLPFLSGPKPSNGASQNAQISPAPSPANTTDYKYALQLKTFTPPPSIPPTIIPTKNSAPTKQTGKLTNTSPGSQSCKQACPVGETLNPLSCTCHKPVPTPVHTGPPECTGAQDSQIVSERNKQCPKPQPLDLRSPSGQAWIQCKDRVDKQMESKLGCVGKPVIYLYPTVPTQVSVKLIIPGTITTSIPSYPEEGWQNITAYPSGKLMYQGVSYQELYYETAVYNIQTPDTGIVLNSNTLSQQLSSIVTRLGLLPSERQEFLDYWLPRLASLHSQHILFSLINPTEKRRIDHVEITPKPDTFIAFLAYFRPLQTAVNPLKPLALPKTPPKRIGFTAVEWGGTINY